MTVVTAMIDFFFFLRKATGITNYMWKSMVERRGENREMLNKEEGKGRQTDEDEEAG